MKSMTFLLIIFAFISATVSGQVSISTDNSTPAPSAMLDVKSTSKGFLPPRMTTAQRTAIVTPEPGLTIFNTDLNCLEFFQAGGIGWYCPCLSSFTIGCSSAVATGSYTSGAALNASNAIFLTVMVNSPGGYNIRTKLINGCTFKASGTFTTTGFQTVTLTGTGTPVSPGQFTFLLLLSNTESTCSVTINFINSIGMGIDGKDFPFYTYYEDCKSQMLYNSSELQAAGHSSGTITAIGFNVTYLSSSQVMNGFQIRMKNTPSTTLSGTFETGLTLVYNGTYTVPGTGWQMITLQTPFTWNGFNLLVQICFDNDSYTYSNTVAATNISNMAQYYVADNSSGCSFPNAIPENYRPNISFQFNNQSPSCSGVVVSHFSGPVAPENKTVIYSTVVNIPGEPTKCWITKNLGATQQATAVNDATEASAGWYWQFNRKQGYKHDGTTLTPNTNWITSINENTNWQTANDPCNLELGTPWRLPTYTEWYNVDNTGGWSNWNYPWGSGLKLHAAGFLISTNGELGNRGLNGMCWSNTQYSTVYGRYLVFNDNTCEIFNESKVYGFSVRCLKDQ